MVNKLPTSEVAKSGCCSSAAVAEPKLGACAEFVKFCKEQHLRARSAETFIRVLHNHSWEQEVAHIREAMRPEVDAVFAPIEKALTDGVECREVMAKLIRAIHTYENKK